jgi:hypothetical protein
MKAEKILEANDIPVTLIPTPRQISSDCGMAVQVDCREMTRAKTILDEEDFEIEGAFEIET